jgi:glycosyltransferase involved in cell wall biosynthesis
MLLQQEIIYKLHTTFVLMNSSFFLPLTFSLFCAVIGIQVFYYLYFFSRLAFYKQKTKKVEQEHPVSVIICARNEAKNLLKNLPGVLVQNYRTTHEVIVVNDNSTDETIYILKEFQHTFKQLNVINLSQEAKFIPGKKFPLSVGIKSAKHEVVLLTDADCVPASEFWIQKMQNGYGQNTEIVLGYGAYYKKRGLLNKLIRFETFHSALQYLSFALSGIPYMGVGRNLSYKKELFLKNKGFSSLYQVPGGDDDLFMNLVASKHNTAIVIDKEAHTLSMPMQTWSSWLRQKRRHYTTAKYYKWQHRFLLGLYACSSFLLYPLLALLLIVHYKWIEALVLYAIRLVLLAYVWKKTMKKLNEKDLWPYFLFFDVWMFFYYLLFVSFLWKKPSDNWK